MMAGWQRSAAGPDGAGPTGSAVGVEEDPGVVAARVDEELQLGLGVDLQQLSRRLADLDADQLAPSPLAEQLADELKFSDCLPAGLALRIADARLADPPSVHACLAEPRRGWNGG